MMKPITKEQRAEMRPVWWPEWTDYPHSSWDVQRAREMSKYVIALEESYALLEQERDLAVARMATATVCEECGGKGKRLINNCVAGTVATYEIKCPHCTNGVVISDERARELLERLKRAEEDSELLDWLEGEYEREHAAMAMGAHTTYIFRKNLPITRDAIRAARAKEGAAE